MAQGTNKQKTKRAEQQIGILQKKGKANWVELSTLGQRQELYESILKQKVKGKGVEEVSGLIWDG
jgi:hypothetical protein